MSENCLVVLPTGLGKTTVALHVIAEYLAKGIGGVLFLAPTRVLANQHYEYLKNNLTIDDISLVTGEDTIAKRKKNWENSVVCATPEITKNDLDRQIVSQTQFNLVIFDEAHRTIGDYSYSGIEQRFAQTNARILAMTDTLPREKENEK
ncbi:MAG: DEAD/DEAH box helicase family protein [Nitrosopumilales archaeon]|nr:DEAD/DEAH box helicase family protein [Nitrosopumilales archaeon]